MNEYSMQSIRFPASLKRLLKVRSLMHHRSFNAEVIHLLETALAETERLDGEIARVLRERQIKAGG